MSTEKKNKKTKSKIDNKGWEVIPKELLYDDPNALLEQDDIDDDDDDDDPVLKEFLKSEDDWKKTESILLKKWINPLSDFVMKTTEKKFEFKNNEEIKDEDFDLKSRLKTIAGNFKKLKKNMGNKKVGGGGGGVKINKKKKEEKSLGGVLEYSVQSGLFKGWKSRFCKVFYTSNVLKIYKEGNEKSKEIGSVDLKDCYMKNIKEVYNKKEFCFSITTKDMKIHYFACKSSFDKDYWLKVIDDGILLTYKVNYSKDDLEEIFLRIEEIFSVFNSSASDTDKTVTQLAQLHSKYPFSLIVVLFLSDFHCLKNNYKEAVKILEDRIIRGFTDKIKEFSEDILHSQFQLNFRLGNIYKKLYEGKKQKFLKLSAKAYEVCKLINPKKQDVLEHLATVYDLMKDYDKSVPVWKKLLSKNETNRRFMKKYVFALKFSSNQQEVYLYFLLEQNKKKIGYDFIYKELSELISMKILKKEYFRKSEFYSFVPNFVLFLKYSRKYYNIYQKTVKKTIFTSKDNSISEIIKEKNSETSELLVCILCSIIKDSSISGNMEKVIKVIFGEIDKRIKEKFFGILELVLNMFKVLENRIIVFKTAVLLTKYADNLKKDMNYDIFFNHLLKLYTGRKMCELIAVFKKLQDRRTVHTLVPIAMYADVVEYLDYRKQSCLAISFFITKSNKKYIIGRLEKLLKKLDPVADEQMKIVGCITLYSITKDKKYTDFLKNRQLNTKMKDIPQYIVKFIGEMEHGTDVFSLLLSSVKKK